MDSPTTARPDQATGPERPADLDGLERTVGIKDDGRPGPLVLITAGLHGNEPAGVRALRGLLHRLEDVPTGGRIVGLAGNLAALREGVRHQGLDLNRLWTEGNVRALGDRAPEDDLPDEAELRALFSAVEAERTAAHSHARDVVLIDLHSTSADGGAFSVVPDSLPSRRLGRAIGLPAVLGLEERIEGPLMTWLVAQGDTAVVVEGGQHAAGSTQDVLLMSLIVALDHLGVLPEGHASLASARAVLTEARGDAPEVLDLVYAHDLPEGTRFAMNEGWTNFKQVAENQELAHEFPPGEPGRPVDAPLAGYMLMPLYQGLGSEGFFLCRPVSRRWLFASRLLRRSWIERFLWLLPGVKRLDMRAGVVIARRGIPHWRTQVLHLFGYRKHAPSGEITRWSRRPQ